MWFITCGVRFLYKGWDIPEMSPLIYLFFADQKKEEENFDQDFIQTEMEFLRQNDMKRDQGISSL